MLEHNTMQLTGWGSLCFSTGGVCCDLHGHVTRAALQSTRHKLQSDLGPAACWWLLLQRTLAAWLSLGLSTCPCGWRCSTRRTCAPEVCPSVFGCLWSHCPRSVRLFLGACGHTARGLSVCFWGACGHTARGLSVDLRSQGLSVHFLIFLRILFLQCVGVLVQ
jgi:hypothetical protein